MELKIRIKNADGKDENIGNVNADNNCGASKRECIKLTEASQRKNILKNYNEKWRKIYKYINT